MNIIVIICYLFLRQNQYNLDGAVRLSATEERPVFPILSDPIILRSVFETNSISLHNKYYNIMSTDEF